MYNSSSADEIASFVPCPVSFLQNIHVYGAIHTILFAWTGRTRGQPIADGASLFEEVYAESDAHFPIIGEPDILIVHPLQFAIRPLQPLL